MEFAAVVLWFVGIVLIAAGVYLWLGVAALLIVLGLMCVLHVVGIMKHIGEKP